MRKALTGFGAVLVTSLVAASDRVRAEEVGPYNTRQPSTIGNGGKVGVVAKQCPETYYISAFRAIKDNNNQRAIDVWCMPLPQMAGNPTDLTEKGPFNTKEAPSNGGGAKVKCPDRFYVSALALRVDAPGGLGGQRSVDFWCKPFPKLTAMPSSLGEVGSDDTGYDPHHDGASRTVHSPNGYFISAIQIVQGPNPAANPVRKVHVWYRPIRQN